MIIVKLIGGLGNQMFQYAVARNLAVKHTTVLYVDLRSLNKRDNSVDYTIRDFELSIFDLELQFFRDSMYDKVKRKIQSGFRPIQYINENGFLYDKRVLTLQNHVYLNGFWQNERYFKETQDIIRKDFTFRLSAGSEVLKIQERMDSQNSISMHIRRGDYISNPTAADFHGVCTSDYYEKAMIYMEKKISNPYYYVFSDDIDWVKNNIHFNQPHAFIDFNRGKSSFEDMRLMSACKHNIIANSSFSWWGAWLNTNADKIVIAPQKWYKTIETDVIPNEWIKI